MTHEISGNDTGTEARFEHVHTDECCDGEGFTCPEGVAQARQERFEPSPCAVAGCDLPACASVGGMDVCTVHISPRPDRQDDFEVIEDRHLPGDMVTRLALADTIDDRWAEHYREDVRALTARIDELHRRAERDATRADRERAEGEKAATDRIVALARDYDAYCRRTGIDVTAPARIVLERFAQMVEREAAS